MPVDNKYIYKTYENKIAFSVYINLCLSDINFTECPYFRVGKYKMIFQELKERMNNKMTKMLGRSGRS